MVLAPIASAVPAVATAPALILTGLLMCREIGRIDVAALDTAIPALLTIVMVPLTYSISHGIGAGFVAFVAIKLLSGRWRDPAGRIKEESVSLKPGRYTIHLARSKSEASK